MVVLLRDGVSPDGPPRWAVDGVGGRRGANVVIPAEGWGES